MMSPQTKKKYKAILASQYGLQCYYCETEMPLENLTIDHIYPKSFGGRNRIGNLILSCKPCNLLKGNRVLTIEEFKQEVMGFGYTPNSRITLDIQRAKVVRTYKKLSTTPIRERIRGPDQITIIRKADDTSIINNSNEP